MIKSRAFVYFLVILLSGLFSFGAAIASELIAVEVVAGIDNARIEVVQGGSVTFTIRVSASGNTGTSNTFTVATRYSVNGAAGSASTPSAPIIFSGNADNSTTITGTAVAASDAVPGDYNIEITKTFSVQDKLKDNELDQLTIRVIAATPTDTIAPSASISSGPSGWINSQSATFSWTGEDNVTATANLLYSWKLDNGAWSAFSSATSTDLTGLAEGSHTFYVKSKDAAANESVAASRSFGVDITLPELTWGTASPAANDAGWNKTDVTIPYTTDDNLSGIASATPGSPLIFDTEGATLSRDVIVTDNAGNTKTFTSPTVKIDKTAPVIDQGTPTGTAGNNGWWRSAVTVPFSATDNLSGFDADGTTTKSLTSKTISVEGTGLTVTSDAVSDWAGNSTPGLVSGTFNIDWTEPTITVNHVDGALLALSGSPVFRFTVSDAGSGFGETGSISATLNGLSINADTNIPLNTGVYNFSITATDLAGNTKTSTGMVVVYDPSAGFVTGGGWIDSPVNASKAFPSAVGKANFGFVSKYQKGANVPTGNTQFQFKAGNLNFTSTEYEWLVITGGNKAQYKGSGTINGEGRYKFMLYAADGGTRGADTFRIKIYSVNDDGTEDVIYDNKEDMAIAGGSIVVHSK